MPLSYDAVKRRNIEEEKTNWKITTFHVLFEELGKFFLCLMDLFYSDMLQRKKMFINWGGKILSELTCVVSQACQLKSVLGVVWSWCESLFSTTPFSRVIASCTCWKLSGLWHHPSSHHHSFPGNRHWKVNSLTVGRHIKAHRHRISHWHIKAHKAHQGTDRESDVHSVAQLT